MIVLRRRRRRLLLGKIVLMLVMVRRGEMVQIFRLLRTPPGFRLGLTQMLLLLLLLLLLMMMLVHVKLLRVMVGL
jgi:hypothetical protein